MLWEAVNDDGGIKVKDARDRLKAAKAENAEPEEIAALTYVVKLFNAEAAAKKTAKNAKVELDSRTLAKYPILQEREICSILISHKWRESLGERISRVSSGTVAILVERLETLGNRYESTVRDIESELAQMSERVRSHLVKMGFSDA